MSTSLINCLQQIALMGVVGEVLYFNKWIWASVWYFACVTCSYTDIKEKKVLGVWPSADSDLLFNNYFKIVQGFLLIMWTSTAWTRNQKNVKYIILTVYYFCQHHGRMRKTDGATFVKNRSESRVKKYCCETAKLIPMKLLYPLFFFPLITLASYFMREVTLKEMWNSDFPKQYFHNQILSSIVMIS